MNNLVAASNGSPLPHDTLLPFGVRAAGPMMPEVPSDAQWSAIVTTIDQHIKPNGRIADVYADIRSALMQEQS